MRSSSLFARTNCANLNLPSGVLLLSIGSGQQKLSSPAIFDKSTPAHTAFLTASSTAAAAIAPASMSLYLGDIPFDTTSPRAEP